jgi:hypothetical protein
VATLVPKPGERVELELHPWYYSEPNQIFLSKSSSIDFDRSPEIQKNLNLVNSITDTFLQSASLGNRCMKDYRIKKTRQAQTFQNVAIGEQFFDCENYNFITINETDKAHSSFWTQLESANFSLTKIGPECDCSTGIFFI